MEGFVIEFASRAGEFLFRQPLKSLPATVGRALNNDFIVDDPHVAAQHLRLEADPNREDGLLVTDLGSRNGLFKDGQRTVSAALRQGERVHFGHTTLQLRHVNEEVAPERLDQFASQFFSRPTALLLLGVALISTLIEVYFSHLQNITAMIWLSSAMAFIAVMLGWSAFWSILGRIFAGRAQYVAHLAIAGWAYLASSWGGHLCSVLAFSFSWPPLSHVDNILFGLVGIWALRRHLSLAQMRWPRLNLPIAIISVALPLTFGALNNWKNEHRILDIDTLDELYDPALRVSGDQSLDQFIAGMPALRQRADDLRKSSDAGDDSSDEESSDD